MTTSQTPANLRARPRRAPEAVGLKGLHNRFDAN